MLIALTSLMSFQLSLLKALNNNAAAIQALTTMVLVGVTAWYVYLTRQMLQAARTSQRPYVYIDVSGEGGLAWELGVTNCGERAAEDVSFEILRELDDFRGNPLSDKTALGKGIRYLPPGRGYRYNVLLPQDITSGPPGTNVLDVRTRYSYAGTTYNDRLTIDFADLDSVLLTSFQTSSDKMAGSLREIAQLMHRRDIRDTPWQVGPSMKGCPICSESIRATATKCPKCREWLPEERLENDAAESGPGSAG